MKVVLIFFVKIYQYTLSYFLGGRCRFSPSCSVYMIEALEEWGAIKGLILGIKRIGKCHPFGDSGYDPVPKNDKNSELN